LHWIEARRPFREADDEDITDNHPHNLEGAQMIALSLVLTWLALTAGALVALSALSRVAARSDVKADLAMVEGQTIALIDTRPALLGHPALLGAWQGVAPRVNRVGASRLRRGSYPDIAADILG
jgi:hypothetical protein